MGISEAGRYDATGEVRFAVVLYGGVSLAIYMNGIVQELLQLVRATAPAPDDDGHLWWADDDLRGAGPVYRQLGCLLDRGVAGTGEGPVRTRFVVDIVTGTSAGGINGVFLAKALATDRDIAALSDLWVREGDIDKLLNDAHAADDVSPLKPQRPPASLLSGQRMLYLLLKALDGVSRAKPRSELAEPSRSPYANEIDLWVTATDLQGRPVTVQTWDPERLGDIREASHRTTFHFRYDATSQLLGDDTGATGIANTLDRSHDPVMAFAARCTSSFPGAFQAVQLADLDDPITGVAAIARATAGDGKAPDWVVPGDVRLDPFFADYGGATQAALHSFADGGYLDNQPVDLVMETLPKRRADVPVARRILLVDPDPGGPPPSTKAPARPDPDAPPAPDIALTGVRVDLLATLIKVVTLPRVQTIGGDVDKILALREPCRVRNQVYAALDARFATEAAGDTPDPDPTAGATVTPGSVAANALRRALTARDVAEAVARVGYPDRQYPAGSQHHAMATRLVSLWAADQEPPAAPDPFLESLDLGFELRRINFLQARIGHRMTSAISADDFSRDSALRRRLDAVYATLAARARELRFRRPDPSPVVVAARAALGAMERGVDFTGPPTDVDVQLRALLQPGLAVRVAVDALMAEFAAGLALPDARRRSLEAVTGDAELTALWHRFAAYDEATLPLRDLLPGENDDIEVLRVSPRDTWRLVDDAARGPKLAGTQVHHFGGFFSADWRRNDILWGRLDAAERLISALWPATADPAQRDELIANAHAGIIGDVLRDADYRALLGALVPGGLSATVPDGPVPTTEITAVISAIRENYRIPPPPPAQARVELATRAARVADGVARGLPATPGPLAPVRTWAGRIVHVATSLVELALPNRVSSILGRHLLDVALIAGVLIIVLGGLVGGPGVTSFGWVVVLTVLGLRLALALVRSWLAHGRWKLGVAIAAALVVAVVVYGLLSWSGWPRAVAFLAIGLAVGLVLGVLPALLHRRPRHGATPVVAAALAVVVLIALATAAVGHGRNDVADRVCRLDDSWYRTVAERVVVVSCAP